MCGNLGESEGSQLGRDYTLLSRACDMWAIALDGAPFTVNDLKNRMRKPSACARYAALKAEDARLREMSDATVYADGCDDFDELVAWAQGGGAREAYIKWRQTKTNGAWTPPSSSPSVDDSTDANKRSKPDAAVEDGAPPNKRARLDVRLKRQLVRFQLDDQDARDDDGEEDDDGIAFLAADEIDADDELFENERDESSEDEQEDSPAL